MAILALHCGVRPQKREAILVILDLLDSNIPTLDRVTLGAVRAHLALMHVGMAVLAILAHVREDWFYMALCTLHFFVHAAQWVFGVVVIELWRGFNRLPTGRGVAVLTRNF
ncbi:MAG TPA: hypothetical protein VJO16_14400 [Candidatus Acidoferrum sp.]|nr:hypothetical protein [Candidatus Acidoferrum sp.]